LIGLPDGAGCRRLLAKHLGEVRLAEELRQDDLAERLRGIVPADLEAICSTAKRMAMRRLPLVQTNCHPPVG